MTKRDARLANLALKGADLLDVAADRLAASGWIETGMVVLLLGRALVSGHRIAKAAREAGQKVRLLRFVPAPAQPSTPAQARAEDRATEADAGGGGTAARTQTDAEKRTP